MERWKTFHIPMKGGLQMTVTPLEQAVNMPGSLTQAINFETSRKGGYRRISGYTKFDTAAVPGTGPLAGVFVFKGNVIACRNEHVYVSTGSGWTQLTTSITNPNASKYTVERFNWGVDTILLTDAVNKPIQYDGTNFTRVTDAPAGAYDMLSFKRHMFLAVGNKVIFSSPNDATDYTAANGAGEINIGFQILGLGRWRDQLYVFGRNEIAKIVGNNATDFVMQTVTQRIGLVHRDTIREVGSNLLFLADDGVRTVSGTERIGDVELGSVSEPIYPIVNVLPENYRDGTFSSAVVSSKSQYRLFFNTGTEPKLESKGIIGCLNTSSGGMNFEWFESRGFQVACSDSDYTSNEGSNYLTNNGSNYVTNTEITIHGDFDGYVYQQDEGNSFDGDNIVAYLSTPYITYDDPEIRKTLYKLRVNANVEGVVEPSVGLQFDIDSAEAVQPADFSIDAGTANFAIYGEAEYGTDLYSGKREISASINVMGSGYSNAFVITSNDTRESYSIQELIVTYATHGRR